MNPQLVGEPAVAAFLRSVLRNLGGISRLKPDYRTYLFYDFTQDLEKLKQKLVFFQGLVMDGEAKRLNDPAVDEWMDELKDLLYDVEDIFDDIRSLWKDQVSNNFPLLAQFSHDMKDRLNQILARTKKLGEDAETLKLERGRNHAFWEDQWKFTLRTREYSSMVDISEIHGREEDKDVIVEMLLQVDPKLIKTYDVVGIVGMGGIGKTTLAQLVFNDPRVEKHFDMKSWVCISNVFDVSKATKDLIVNSDDNEDGKQVDQLSLDSLQRRLSKMVEKKKFLFVLDDVWSSSEWGIMKRPFSKCANGSKILVTTRNIKIAQTLGNKNPYQLQVLNHEKCMEIFRDKAFRDNDEETKRVDLAGKIVRACGGVPLLIKVIGSMLHGANVEKWRAVSENIVTWANTNDEILPVVRLSYYDLPASLKRCFEYLSLFPPDHRFYQDEIVQLWIAEGLVEEEEGRRVEDIGNEYYNELKTRSLIQENGMMHDIVHDLATVLSRKFFYKENSKEPPAASVRHAYLVKLNATHDEFLAKAPCLRTLIVEFVEDENVLGNTIKYCKMIRALTIGYSLFESTSSLGECLKDLSTNIRFLNIKYSSIRHLPDSLCVLDNLQFLDLYYCEKLENLPDGMNQLSNLRHLIVTDSAMSSLPESICRLSQLQVLSLNSCEGLTQLPKDIGNLRSLRILDVGYTSIVNLPESICALDQLQVLSLHDCDCLTRLPEDIGNLRSLRELNLLSTSISSLPKSILNVTGLQKLRSDHVLPLYIGSIAGLKEVPRYHVGNEEERHLGESTKLNIMNMLGGHLVIAMDNNGSVEEANIVDLKSRKNIRGLAFRWKRPGNDEEMEVKIMEALKPHPALESLEFSNYGGDKFPAWFMSTNICWSNLVQLKMEGLNKICEMMDLKFVVLRILRIENCPKLRKVLMATPKLVSLSIMNCGELEADCVYLLPSLSDKADIISVISQLMKLDCSYNIFEYLLDKLKTANSKWDKLEFITLRGEGRRFASMPRGWPRMFESLEWMYIFDIAPGKFQFLHYCDISTLPAKYLIINLNYIISKPFRHWYIIE